MANHAPLIPLSITAPPLTADNTPDALPWAIDGIVLPPTLGDDATGWLFGTEPDARLANFLNYYQSQINDRTSTTGFFCQRATEVIQIISSSSPTAGDTLTLHVSALSDTYVVTAGDAAAMDPYMSIAANWAQQLRTSTLRNILVGATALSPFMLVAYKDPGTAWPATPTLSATGTLSTSTISDFIGGSAGQLAVMSAPAGTNAVDTDLLHGASDPEGAGVKLQFRNGAKNGAFRAGKFTGTQADLANVGESSTATGLDSIASGAKSVALGSATAAASGGVAIGDGASVAATATNAVALGTGVVAADAIGALAAGGTVNQPYGVATGVAETSKDGEVSHASANVNGADRRFIGSNQTVGAVNVFLSPDATDALWTPGINGAWFCHLKIIARDIAGGVDAMAWMADFTLTTNGTGVISFGEFANIIGGAAASIAGAAAGSASYLLDAFSPPPGAEAARVLKDVGTGKDLQVQVSGDTALTYNWKCTLTVEEIG